MKKSRYTKMLLFIASIFILAGVHAQENKTGKVILKIEKEGKTVIDTVFNLKEGQDPEELTETISKLAGEDFVILSRETGEQKIILLEKQGGDRKCHMEQVETDTSKECKEKKVMVFVEGEGQETHECKMIHELGIDLDSLKKVHEGANVLVMKDENGKITTKVVEKDAKWISEEEEGASAGKTYKIIITDEDQPGENEEVYVIKTDKGKKIEVTTKKSVVVSSTGEDEEGPVKVIVIGDDDKAEKNIQVTVKVLDDDKGDMEKGSGKKEKEEGKRKK